MQEELLVIQCSPTMAGLKTGSLFTCPLEDRRTLTDTIRQMNRRFGSRGIRILPMKYMKDRILVYMYRPERLAADLKHQEARKILGEMDYPIGNPDRCVVELVHRLNQEEEFPHEIGLFLGYPPEDVRGFMTLGGSKAKYTGIWQAYGDVEHAKRTYRQYQECTRRYYEAFRRYHSIDRLVVSCS